jgi:hypothetical protein
MSRASIPPYQGGGPAMADDRANVVVVGRTEKLAAGGVSEVPSKIIPFPAAYRRGEIQKLAARMMNFSAERAESHLRHQIRIKAETMRRRGIAEDEIARQAKGFEWAVRVELWRCVFGPRGSHRGPPQ